ncbi:peptidase T [Anaerotruncus sp. DFI.9.16]|uniref:peptidase T n=1 Tax=Anaerotruncus sp. DFI.9.16 TaxID=2965275 RepID=UPI00210939F7|nr:peptidase T [Anaerotruncus sp. DFI.9.16]MCQ4894363.1 peptidase T [Anaerotruncus sp. DFI.9.16]
MQVKDRFLKYVSYDTQSDDDNLAAPSTEKQLVLANELVREMREMGITDAAVDGNGIVTGTVPGNAPDAPVLGLIAHYDTSPALTGTDVKPRVIEGYDGSDIPLNAEHGIVMKVSEFGMLRDAVGEDLIVTDGNTLLGADDKAGVAEIMTAAERLLADAGRPHGTIRLGFTPDEEVGRGADHFDVAAFGADYAYTVDGGPVGELEFENFNAATAKVTVTGQGIHPGDAKDRMINASRVAVEFQSMLPERQTPENTEGYEGFIHLMRFDGGVEEARLAYILRDHDAEKLEEKKRVMRAAGEFINGKYGKKLVSVELVDEYRNMKEQILPHFHLIDNARRAMEEVGIEPNVIPIRGGTDGARLSYMGLPCPNLGTGGQCFHGRYEHITVQSLERNVELLMKIAEIYAKRPG